MLRVLIGSRADTRSAQRRAIPNYAAMQAHHSRRVEQRTPVDHPID
jgi:hypothetical protein